MALARTQIKRKKTNATTKADVLFSRLVRNRDHACLMCGSPNNLQAAHIWSRRYRSIRWRFENCITLCQGDHLKMTLRPAEWGSWCEDHLFCAERGIHTGTCDPDHVTFEYIELRHRALYDPPEKAVDALVRLNGTP
jgi:hypothetical protein